VLLSTLLFQEFIYVITVEVIYAVCLKTFAHGSFTKVSSLSKPDKQLKRITAKLSTIPSQLDFYISKLKLKRRVCLDCFKFLLAMIRSNLAFITNFSLL